MAQGIAESDAGIAAWRKGRGHLMNAGMAFIKAREAVGEGNFGALLETYEQRISRTTVYRHVMLVEEALTWAAQDKPALQASPTALFEHAKAMVMLSPKGMVALLRQLGEMRKFGEYDAVKYQQKKLLGNGEQMELDFGKLASAVEMLSFIDTALLELPEGKTEDEALEEIEEGLQSAIHKVRTRRGIETGNYPMRTLPSAPKDLGPGTKVHKP